MLAQWIPIDSAMRCVRGEQRGAVDAIAGCARRPVNFPFDGEGESYGHFDVVLEILIRRNGIRSNGWGRRGGWTRKEAFFYR